MNDLTVPAAIILVVAATASWRAGLTLLIVAALVEGPLRKLTAEQPVAFVLLPGAVFAALALNGMGSGLSLLPKGIAGWGRYVLAPFAAYTAVVALQALSALLTTGSPIVPIFGLLVYLGPIIAISFAHSAALRLGPAGIERFIWTYALWAGLAVLTVYLEALEVDWTILGEVGEGLTITAGSGTVSGNSGLYRASEIAAWHGAVSCCLMITLAVRRGLSPSRAVFLIAFVALMIGAGVLTGRRKMIVTLAVFICTYAALLFLFTAKAGRLAAVVGGVGLVGFLASVALVDLTEQSSADKSLSYEIYLQRQQETFAEIPERLVTLGIAPIQWAMDRVGPLGGGVGISGQGARFVGVDSRLAGGAGEGGLGKIVVEIGLPGLAISLWLIVAFGRMIYEGLAMVASTLPQISPLGLGIASTLVANVASYTVATQAFGDPMILILLGILTGFLLAQPTLAQYFADLEKAEAADHLHSDASTVALPEAVSTSPRA